MVRFLAPQPNLDYLKNEAKSLRNAHRRGDPKACAVLRNLKRFASATDEEILAADVPLTDVHFALALDYGFTSWQELRQTVLRVKPSPDYVANAQTNALVLDNAPGGIGEPSNRFAAALSVALTYMGARADITSVMGDSGLAFIFQADSLHHPYDTKVPQLDMGWWPLDQWGVALRLEFLSEAYGVPLQRLPGNASEYRSDAALHYRKYHETAVARNLRDGRPVITIADDQHVVFGLDDGSPPLLGQVVCEAKATLSRLPLFPWDVFVLGEPGEPLDRREVDVRALEFAVRLGRDEVDLSDVPGKSSGRKSWRLWLSQLTDPQLRGPHFYHANVAGHLWINRTAASAYLREMAMRHPQPIRNLLTAAASQYDAVARKIGQADTSKEAFHSGTGPETLIGLIREAIAMETSAQAQMAKAIEAML